MRHLLSVGITCFLSGWLATASLAETYFVNNMSGSDLNNGLVDANQGVRIGPLKSIGGALKRARRGDRIELANTGQPYRECITLQGGCHSGYSSLPFIIEGNGATLDGTAAVPVDRWEAIGDDLYRFMPKRRGYQSLFLDGKLASRVALENFPLQPFQAAPGKWFPLDGGIAFVSRKGMLPIVDDLRFAEHRVGITLYDVERVVIRGLEVVGFQLDGINAHDNAMDCVLTDVVCMGNGRSGVSVGGASRVRLFDCELIDNGDTQLNTEGWSTTRLIRTNLIATATPTWRRQLNAFGQGPRIFVDGQGVNDTEGRMTDEQLEAWRQELERRRQQAEAATGVAPKVAPDVAADGEDGVDRDEPTQPVDPAATADPDDEATDDGPDPFADDPFGGDMPADSADFGGDPDSTDDTPDASDDDPFSAGDADLPFGDEPADDLGDEDPFSDL